MLSMFYNLLILLGGIGLPILALFWKNFSRKPGEIARAIITTLVGMIGMTVFFLQVAIMTYQEPGQNLVTIIISWLETH